MKKAIIITILAFLLVVGGAFVVNKLFFVNPNGEEVYVDENKRLGGLAGIVRDVVGTRVATTTTAVGFYGANAASTTYPTFIGFDVDEVIYDIYFANASTSSGSQGSNAYFSILTSQDNECDTATTSYDYGNPYLKQEIQWSDASDHLKNKVHSTSLSNATSTIGITNPQARTSKKIILEDLISNCVALEVSASSTELQVQLTPKQHN